MVTVLLLTLMLSQPATPPAPQTTKPRPPASATTTATITVTDGTGAGIGGVLVEASGPIEREGKTTADGMLRLQGLRAGTYRLRFSREGFYTFEKEVTWRAGQAAPDVPVTLTAAPPPPSASSPTPPPVAPTPSSPSSSKLPQPGQAKTIVLPDFIEKNFINGRDPHKEDLVGCSGVGQAMVWQVLAPWEGRQHTGADAMLYVIGGEGSIRLDGRDVSLGAGSFAVVPRGATYALMRRGRNPLIVLAMLAGAPCAA